MITLPAAAFALGALTLVQIAQTGFADTIVSDVEISVRQVRPSSGSDPETRSARRVETTIELIEGRQTRFFFDDDGPLYFGSLFRAGTDGDGRSVSVEITASRTQEAEEVLYDLIVTLVDADGEVLGDALNPRLLSQAGESVQMTLGVDGPEDMDDWLDIRLTPQIVRAQ